MAPLKSLAFFAFDIFCDGLSALCFLPAALRSRTYAHMQGRPSDDAADHEA